MVQNARNLISRNRISKEKQKNVFNIWKTDADLVSAEEETRTQSECDKWLEIRKNILTASNSGTVSNTERTAVTQIK